LRQSSKKAAKEEQTGSKRAVFGKQKYSPFILSWASFNTPRPSKIFVTLVFFLVDNEFSRFHK